MRLTRTTNPALILVDIQKGFDEIEYWGGQRNNPDAEKNAAALLSVWRAYSLPIFHVKHCSQNPGSPLHETNAGNEFKEEVKPRHTESVIHKNVNSAFIGTDLKDQLGRLDVTKLVIVGLTTDHCVSTTARMAGNFGFDTYLVSDAMATFNKRGPDGKNYPAELMHETALASLNEEFATVIITKQLLDSMSK